jgi:transposase-like protein
MYGIEVSPTLISNVTNKIVPLIKEWQNRPLQGVYAVVFLDAIHLKSSRTVLLIKENKDR